MSAHRLRHRSAAALAAFLTALLAAPQDAALRERSRDVCALYDVHYLGQIEDRARVDPLPGRDLAVAFGLIMDARAACRANEVARAIALYDMLSGEMGLARPR